MEVITRRAILADAEALSAISKRTFYDTFTGTCTEADMDSFLEEYFNLPVVKEQLFNENDMYYLAEVEGEIVGYLRFMEDYDAFPHMKQWKSLELKRIYIEKGFHGKGVAQSLLDIYTQHLTEHNYKVAWLGVWEHNLRAQRFYEKMGFVDSGFRHDFPIGDTPQTDIWMWKFL